MKRQEGNSITSQFRFLGVPILSRQLTDENPTCKIGNTSVSLQPDGSVYMNKTVYQGVVERRVDRPDTIRREINYSQSREWQSSFDSKGFLYPFADNKVANFFNRVGFGRRFIRTA